MDSPSYLPPSMIMRWRDGYDDKTGKPHAQAGAITCVGGMCLLQSAAGSRSSTHEMLAGVHGENDSTYGAAHTGRTAARGRRRLDQWRGAWQRWAARGGRQREGGDGRINGGAHGSDGLKHSGALD